MAGKAGKWAIGAALLATLSVVADVLGVVGYVEDHVGVIKEWFAPNDSGEGPVATGPTVTATPKKGSAARPTPRKTTSKPKPRPTTPSPIRTTPQGPVEVPLETLCGRPDHTSYICGVDNGSIEVGDQVFSYVAEGNGFAYNKPPNWHPLFGLDEGNNCSELVIQYASRSDANGTVNIRLTQGNADPQLDSAAIGEVGTFRARLNGTPLRLTFNTTDGSKIFANGHATCRTPESR